MSSPISSPRRLHPGLILALIGISLILIAFFHSRSAPASSQMPEVVTAVESALTFSVVIEGDGVYGAGILLDPQRGLILTNYHVVLEMHSPRVTGYSGRTSAAVLLASDSKRDLALLSAPGLVIPSLPPPHLGDAAHLRPGEEVYAVGMPRKLPFTVSRGIVSFVGRELDGTRYLQLDMNINDGNSGGPVVDSRGQIVGVMSFIYRRAQGLSFAVPTTEIAAAFPSSVAVIPPRF
jgi:S1-C subfamily serine protease